MSDRTPRLRTILSATTVLFTLIAIGVAIVLVVFTTVMHRSAARLANSIESVMLGERVELDLHRYGRTADPVARAEIEQRLRRSVVEAHRFVDSEEERGVLVDADVNVIRYVEAKSGDPTVAKSLERALDSIEEFVRVNRDQAEAERLRAARLDRFADYAAFLVGGSVVALTIWLLWWMKARAFKPVLGLADAMEQFARGDRSVRAHEAGPAELRDMAWRFNQMAASLAAERQAQLTFLAGVAHDLRNPLSALQVSLSPLRPEKPLPPEPRIRQTFERITRQLARLDRMIGDLLDTAAIESGKLELKLERRDARELVREVIELFEGAWKGHDLELDLPDEPTEINCDPSRIVQVITNLVSNAIKYSPGSAKLEIGLGRLGSDAVLSVRDFGIGISKTDRQRLFEPFARGGLSKEAIPGVGLGLFVVRRIVEAHGGSVEVESQIGEGSTFFVRLPLARPIQAARPGHYSVN